ncbi:C4-dicarboxylate transporter DcuC [Tenacibaculum insulae]|uniref:C4-dicarboxylate transporter DcuC n=1 Tax=Tenacibaculum insulae TaxID=2029677 RepID=UPI003AB24A3A
MNYISPIISLVIIIIASRLILKKYNPHAVLLLLGIFLMFLAYILNGKSEVVPTSTGSPIFDFFEYIKNSFSKINAGVGLMIMAIGGFVAYIDKIGASDTLVYVAMKPLKLLKNKSFLAASLVIPIGQALFVAIPSAAGLSLLLMASLFPILLKLGVSRVAAASVITASTCIGMGPASAMTVSSSTIAEIDTIEYFIKDQIPLILPITLVLMISYYFVNKYYDGKKSPEKNNNSESIINEKPKKPLVYAIIPLLPIILLLIFSKIFSLFNPPIVLTTTTAMFVSLFIAITMDFVRTKKLKEALNSFTVFWNGMGNIFKSVVTLIIAADVFANGLINMNFIEGLLNISQSLGFGAVGIAITMSVIIFLASILMGSGNASFFAFGPLVPKIAESLGVKSVSFLLPMQFSASIGRTISPVAGVIIAASDIAKINAIDLVKRNFIPMVSAFIVMLIYHFI